MSNGGTDSGAGTYGPVGASQGSAPAPQPNQGPPGSSILFIGESISGSIEGGILFVGQGNTLQENPSALSWDNTNLVLRTNAISLSGGNANSPSLSFQDFPGTGFYAVPGPFIVADIGTNGYFAWSSTGYILSSISSMRWSTTQDSTSGVSDIVLSRSGVSTYSIAAASTVFPGGNVVITGSGLVLGTPTGGDKGVGTLNVSGDIYKNNTAYTNPDYVLESWATGKIERFKDNEGAKKYGGIADLEAVEAYCRKNLRLPGISDEPAGMFARGDLVLEKIEEIFTYLFQLRRELREARAHEGAAA